MSMPFTLPVRASCALALFDADDRQICDTDHSRVSTEHQLEDLKEIARRVNLHEELLEALKQCNRSLDILCEEVGCTVFKDQLARNYGLIKKAKEGK